MLKSYNIFVDSARGTTLNLHEQAPSGGVVRVSLKSLSVTGSFDLDAADRSVYLRVDAPTNNLESKELAGAENIVGDDLIHSDILGSVQVTSGAGPFSWRAWIPNERSFEVSGSLQSLTLRLTDHRNRALVSTDGSDVGFSCTIGVEVLIKHNVRTLGYGPSPNPVDPKDSKLYIP